MAITPKYNDIELKNAWAEDAATTIPSVPVPGVSYRNTELSEDTISGGQQYDSLGRSADWNELLYRISANIVTLQQGGGSLLWISGRTYEQGALVKDPNNAQIYYRLKAGAGTTRPSSDSTNWQLLQDLFCGEGLNIISNKINWGNTTGQVNNDCNELRDAGIYRVESGTENTPIDIESGSNFRGFIYVVRFGSTTQQIAYEVNTNGAFSMNTRLTANNGSTWTAWTRFGVNFTLDWNTGHDYRAGDLVRDPSNNLIYVCTTLITNSTNRPGLDTSHFTLLQSYLIGDGLTISNSNSNKITWGLVEDPNSVSDIDEVWTEGVYRVNTTTENMPAGSIYGILIVTRFGSNVLQLLQVDSQAEGDFSVFVRSGATNTQKWYSWRIAATFDALDFKSGQTYVRGQLVRGSNSVHYVKKTTASVCNTEPNSDRTNFETLADNLVQDGIGVLNGKLNWGYKNYNNISDCNQATTPGLYFVTGTLVNVPTNESGLLIVLTNNQYGPSWNSTAHLKQLYIVERNIYIRSSNSIGSVSGTTIDPDNINWRDWGLVGPNAVPEGNLFTTGDFVFTYRSARTGFLLCNGAAVSRTTYAALYKVIGTKFGAGNGSTTFNLPDFRGKFAQGANNNLGNTIAAGLPNATGYLDLYADFISASGVFSGPTYNSNRAGGGDGGRRGVNFNLSSSNSIFGSSNTVQPPAIALNVLIKY